MIYRFEEEVYRAPIRRPTYGRFKLHRGRRRNRLAIPNERWGARELRFAAIRYAMLLWLNDMAN